MIRKLGIALGLILSATVVRADSWSEYFPLKEGNSWEYTGGATVTLKGKIDKSLNGWFHVTKLWDHGSPWLKWEKGWLYLFEGGLDTNEGGIPQVPYYRFSLKVGSKYQAEPSIPLIATTFEVVSKNDKVVVPAGVFTKCVRFDIQTPGEASAKDIVDSRWFAPNVGLVKVKRYAMGKTLTRELVRAVINGKTIQRAVAGSLSPDVIGLQATSLGKAPYTLNVTYTVHNTSSKAVIWNLASSKKYDVEIRDAKGKVVYTWSADKKFLMVLKNVTLKPGQKWSFPITLKPQLTPGTYEVRAYFRSASDPNPALATGTIHMVTP